MSKQVEVPLSPAETAGFVSLSSQRTQLEQNLKQIQGALAACVQSILAREKIENATDVNYNLGEKPALVVTLKEETPKPV